MRKVSLLVGVLLLAVVAFAQTPVYYVSPTGSDTNPGTSADAPLATIQKAESLVVTNYLGANCPSQTQPIVVQFLDGEWFNVSVNLATGDSGCGAAAPVLFQGAPGSNPIFSAGILVSNWTTSDGLLWQATLPSTAVSFENLFYNGIRRFRPRLTSTGNLMGDQYRVQSSISGLYDRFTYATTTPVSSTWLNYAASKSNPCGQTAGASALQGDIEVLDFEMWDLSVGRVSCIDATNHIVYLTGATTKNNSHGYITNHRYIFENVRDAFQLPGQFFVDRSVTPWVLYYRTNPGENPNTDRVIVPQAKQVLTGSNVSYRTFQGITFCCDNFVEATTGYAGSQAESQVPAAVSLNNSSYVTFDGDTFTNTAGYGLALPVDFKGTSTGDVVQNNYFIDLGAGGLLTGHIATGAATDANTFQHAVIQNNVVQGYGRKYAGAAGITHLQGHDILTTHNDVSDGYNQGIMLCFPSTVQQCKGNANSGGGFNIVTTYNHIWNLGQGLLNDFGGIYMASYAAVGNQISNNKIHDISDASSQDKDGYGGNLLYIDRGGPITINSNLAYRGVEGLNMTIGPPLAGQQIAASNNIFAYVRKSMFLMFNCGQPGLEQFAINNNIVLSDRTTKSVPPFSIQFLNTYLGTPVGAEQSYGSNDYWNTAETLSTDTKAFNSEPSTCKTKTYYTFAKWQALGEDVGSIVANPGFTNPLYPTDDFSFITAPPSNGFSPFCTAGVGPTCPGRTSGNAVPPVQAGFTTLPFNPATDY